jgi:hypothetical protein
MPARLKWLEAVHPVYEQWATTWARQERLLRGGIYVEDELVRFDWETLATDPTAVGEQAATIAAGAKRVPFGVPGEHYAMRKRQATYFNFCDLFATVTAGHMMQKAPAPDFGTLGVLERAKGVSEPSNAELVFYNVDGVGNDGSQWHNYWATSLKRSMATGHRWHFAEAPVVRPQTQADILAGRRPYLIEWSPLKVSQWLYEAGQLQYAVVRVPPKNPISVDANGELQRNTESDYLLLVRKGCTAVNSDGYDFATGGWWRFSGDDLKTELGTGAWDKTKGEIPLWPLFWERDEGVDGAIDYEGIDTMAEIPAMSRPAMMEIGNSAVAYYNLTSAVNYELWDGAKGMEWLRGVDNAAWELAMEKIMEGSRWAPLPPNKQTQQIPDVTPRQSNGDVIAAFKDRLQQIRDEVRELMSLEVSGTPDASGLSKQAGFGEKTAPRLARVASELEQAQNTAIYFLELRFGAAAPTGMVQWPREFELIDYGVEIERFINAQSKSGMKSKSLTTRALVTMGENAGLIESDEEKTKIEQEYEQDFNDAKTQAAAESALLASTTAGKIKPNVPVPVATGA